MKVKVLRLFWSLLLVYYIIEIVDFVSLDRNHNAILFPEGNLLPRMLYYFDFLIEDFINKANKLSAVLLSNSFLGGGVFLLFLLPAILLDVPATVVHGVVKRIVFLDIVIAIIISFIDGVGCVCLPFNYFCLFSGIIDCFIISLALLSLWAIKGSSDRST